MQTTVRITKDTHALLREIASRERASMQQVLERAIEEYRRRRFLEDVNAGYEALRADAAGWAGVQAERAAWDGTLADGLPKDEVWTTGTEIPRPVHRRGPRAKRAKRA